LRRLSGHRDWVTSAAFTADGASLLTGGRDRQVLLWNVNEGRLRRSLGNQDHPVTAIATSRPGDLAAVVGFRRPLTIYELTSGRTLAVLDCPCRDMRAIAFSPSLDYLAGGGRNGRLRIWDLDAGTHVDIAAHTRRIHALAFTQGGRQLLSAGEDRAVRIWDVASGRMLDQSTRPAGKTMAIAFLNANLLATAGSDNAIRIWRLGGDQPLATLRGHTGSVTALAVSGNLLVSGGFDTTVRGWSLSTDRPSGAVQFANPPHVVAHGGGN
jgi:WD40 repeat protein